MRVGVIGLGQMGRGMAGSLLAAGHDVGVFNRTRSRAEPLGEKGAHIADSVAEVCREAEAVVTCLSDDDALDAVCSGDGGLLAHLPKGAAHVGMSTVSVKCADDLTERHAERGQVFVTAPVFGRPDAAAAGKLFIMAAGPAETVSALAPLFEAMGQRTEILGDRPSMACLAKLAGNFLIASVIESMSEAMALVGKGGLDRQQFLDLLTGTLFGAPVYKTYGQLIVDRKFTPPGFAATLGCKDIRLALAAGDGLQVPMPLASLLRDRLLTLIATSEGEIDWSGLGGLAARHSGQD